jgi:hypothetical protein
MMLGFKKCMDFHFSYVLLLDKSGDIFSFSISFGSSKNYKLDKYDFATPI